MFEWFRRRGEPDIAALRFHLDLADAIDKVTRHFDYDSIEQHITPERSSPPIRNYVLLDQDLKISDTNWEDVSQDPIPDVPYRITQIGTKGSPAILKFVQIGARDNELTYDYIALGGIKRAQRVANAVITLAQELPD